MTPLILNELQKQRWAITAPALRSMLAILDEDSLSVEHYKYFHSLNADAKKALATTFGKRSERTHYTSTVDNVGFLTIDGPITPRATWFSDISGMVSLDTLTNEFKALEVNDHITDIVLLIDSPGGSITGLSDFAALVKASKKTTHTYAWMAASAAYWIGSAADHFVVTEAGEVGSLGVVLTITDYSEADAKRGVYRIDILSSQSPYKRIDFNDADARSVLQTQLDDLADVFIDTVATNRNVDREIVLSKFGKGAMVVARRALDAGMVDRIEDVQTFVSKLVNTNSGVSLYSTAALSAQKEKGETMAIEKAPLTADQIREQFPAAVKEIETGAVLNERDRIKRLESLAAKFDKGIPQVRKAAREAVDSNKFNASMSEADVMAAIVDAVASAQTEAITKESIGRTEVTAVAAHASQAQAVETNEDEKQAAEKKRFSGLLAAMK